MRSIPLLLGGLYIILEEFKGLRSILTIAIVGIDPLLGSVLPESHERLLYAQSHSEDSH